ncbi:MAG: hypothetical protein ACJASQ_001194 [Crocinitomicaceae bacterium]|jgi:hypothetical protein
MAKVSGGVNSNFIVNQSMNQEQFRDPFSWVLLGNITVKFLDLSLPFTFSFSNAGRSYTQPFNMTAVHPTYKNWKTHLGITSMNFSQYTYSGMNFTGAGVEYSPKKWNFKAFGGRLKKAIEYDADVDNVNTVSYSRMGFGFGTEYKGKKFGSELLLFKAYDNAKSLDFYHNNPELTAKDNIVVSLKGNVSLFKGLRLKGEIATSFLTRDILSVSEKEARPFYSSLIQGNNTSVVRNAYNGSIDYKKKTFGIGLKYERIDPEYSTLGAVYFNNDLENITLNPRFSLWKNKINLALSAGVQKNNLDATNASESKRWVGSATLSAQLIKGMGISASYSNLSSFSRRNPTADPFYTPFGDTLNYYQTSENFSGSINYTMGEDIKQSIVLTGSYSKSQNITGRLEDAAAFGFNVDESGNEVPIDVYNGVVSQMFQFTKKKFSIGWMANANHTVALGMTNSFIGPGVNASTSLLDKKMSLNLGSTYNRQYTNAALANHVVNFRLGMRYSPEIWDKKYGKLSMSLNGNWTNRLSVVNVPNRQNITIIANLAYQIQ